VRSDHWQTSRRLEREAAEFARVVRSLADARNVALRQAVTRDLWRAAAQAFADECKALAAEKCEAAHAS